MDPTRENMAQIVDTPERRAFMAELGEQGWLGMTWPKEHGGQEGDGVYEYLLNEALARPGRPQIGKGVGIIGKTLIRHGSEKLKAEFLPKILRNEVEFAVGYSEPNAGSDAASMQLKAVRDGDGWRLNGQKTWTTSAHFAEWYWVGRPHRPRRPQAPRHHAVPGAARRPGPHHPAIWTMGDERTNEVFFDDVFVHDDYVVGDAQPGLPVHRPGARPRALHDVHVLADQRAHQDPASTTCAGRAPRASRCGTTPWSGGASPASSTDGEVARLLGLRFVHASLQGGDPPRAEASEYKLWATELSRRVADASMDIGGPGVADAGRHRGRPDGRPGRVDLPLHGHRHHRRRHLRGAEEHHRHPQARPPQELLSWPDRRCLAAPRGASPVLDRDHRARPVDGRAGDPVLAAAGRLRRRRSSRSGRRPAPACARPHAGVPRLQRPPRHAAGRRSTCGRRRASRCSCAGRRRRRGASRASGPASSTGWASATPRSGRSTPASSTARPPATARPGPTPGGPATTSTTWRSAATSTRSGRDGGDGGPRAARRHGRRHRRRRACRPPRRSWPRWCDATATATAATSTWPWPTAWPGCSRSTSTSTWPPASCPAPGHNILTGRYACYGVYGTARRRLARGRRDRAAVLGQPVPGRWASSAGSTHQTDDDACRTPSAPTCARSSPPRTATSGSRCSPTPTPASSPVNDVAEVVTDPQLLARGAVVEAKHPTAGTFRQLGPVLAGSGPRRPVDELPRRRGHRHRRPAGRRPATAPPRSPHLRAEGAVA